MGSRRKLATKADLKEEISKVNGEIATLKLEMAENKHGILKWMVTAMLVQIALLVVIIAFLR